MRTHPFTRIRLNTSNYSRAPPEGIPVEEWRALWSRVHYAVVALQQDLKRLACLFFVILFFAVFTSVMVAVSQEGALQATMLALALSSYLILFVNGKAMSITGERARVTIQQICTEEEEGRAIQELGYTLECNYEEIWLMDSGNQATESTNSRLQNDIYLYLIPIQSNRPNCIESSNTQLCSNGYLQIPVLSEALRFLHFPCQTVPLQNEDGSFPSNSLSLEDWNEIACQISTATQMYQRYQRLEIAYLVFFISFLALMAALAGMDRSLSTTINAMTMFWMVLVLRSTWTRYAERHIERTFRKGFQGMGQRTGIYIEWRKQMTLPNGVCGFDWEKHSIYLYPSTEPRNEMTTAALV